MNICVIHPKVSRKSATQLAAALKAPVVNPFEKGQFNFAGFDLVFNYGCSSVELAAKKFINHPNAVRKCVNKVVCYKLWETNGIPTVNYVTDRVAATEKPWKHTVCRADKGGNQNSGMEIVAKGDPLPIAAIYSEFYKHKHEFRIVVLKGKVIARYMKKRTADDMWELVHLHADGFEAIDKAVLKASSVLGIDYTGMDVLANSQEEFKVLEANSGPAMTEEVLSIITKEFANA